MINQLENRLKELQYMLKNKTISDFDVEEYLIAMYNAIKRVYNVRLIYLSEYEHLLDLIVQFTIRNKLNIKSGCKALESIEEMRI